MADVTVNGNDYTGINEVRLPLTSGGGAEASFVLSGGGGGTDANAVHYTAETKTDAQKSQARTNIGAISGVIVDGVDLTPDSSGKVTIPYAGTGAAGVIRVNTGSYCTQVTNTGQLQAVQRTLAQYNNASDYAFIGKKTLENIREDLVKRSLVSNSEITDVDDKAKICETIGAVSKIGAGLPDYYDSDFWAPIETAIESHGETCGLSGDEFIFITDIHWETNKGKSPLMLKYLRENTQIQKVFFGGDLITEEDTRVEAVRALRNARALYPEWIPLLGNHECNVKGNNPSAEDLARELPIDTQYAALIRDAESLKGFTLIDEYSYYFEDSQRKIRYIMVGCIRGGVIPLNTRNAVKNVINNTQDGWALILFSHVGIGSAGLTDYLKPIVDALDAIATSTSKSVDVLGVFTGHSHYDRMMTTDAGVTIVSTTTDGGTEEGGLTRTRGTTLEQAFDVVQIDRTNRTVYLTRVGAGQNRSYTY